MPGLEGDKTRSQLNQLGQKAVGNISECLIVTPQSSILYSAKLPFKNEGKIKTFPDKDRENLLLETCLMQSFELKGNGTRRYSNPQEEMKSTSNINVG